MGYHRDPCFRMGALILTAIGSWLLMAHRCVLPWDLSSPEGNCIKQGNAPSPESAQGQELFNFVWSTCLVNLGQSSFQAPHCLCCSCCAPILLLPVLFPSPPRQELVNKRISNRITARNFCLRVCFQQSVAKHSA